MRQIVFAKVSTGLFCCVDDEREECRRDLFVDHLLSVRSKLCSATAIHGVSIDLLAV